MSMYVPLIFFLVSVPGGPGVSSQDQSMQGQLTACYIVGFNRFLAECILSKHIMYVLM